MDSPLPPLLPIQPIQGPVHGSIRPPGSKSITNRALICAALAEGESTLHGALASEDTQVMVDSLQRLGIAVQHDTLKDTIRVAGCGGGIPAKSAELYIANSGTSVRFLTALAALGNGKFRSRWHRAMRERPIRDLLDGLRNLASALKANLVTVARQLSYMPTACRRHGARSRRRFEPVFERPVDGGAYAKKPVELSSDGEFVCAAVRDDDAGGDEVIRRGCRRERFFAFHTAAEKIHGPRILDRAGRFRRELFFGGGGDHRRRNHR